MGWIRLGLLMIGLVIGLGGDLLAQGTAQTIRGKYNPQNEACGTSQTKRTSTHPAEKKRSVTFSGNIPRAFGNHPNALLASVK